MTSPNPEAAPERKIVSVMVGMDGRASVYRVGQHGVTEIRETEKAGHMAMLPAVQVWCGDELWREAYQFGCELEFATPKRDAGARAEDARVLGGLFP